MTMSTVSERGNGRGEEQSTNDHRHDVPTYGSLGFVGDSDLNSIFAFELLPAFSDEDRSSTRIGIRQIARFDSTVSSKLRFRATNVPSTKNSREATGRRRGSRSELSLRCHDCQREFRIHLDYRWPRNRDSAEYIHKLDRFIADFDGRSPKSDPGKKRDQHESRKVLPVFADSRNQYCSHRNETNQPDNHCHNPIEPRMEHSLIVSGEGA